MTTENTNPSEVDLPAPRGDVFSPRDRAAPGDHLQYLLTAYLFDGLSPEGRREVEDHLRSCEECRAELATLQKTRDLIAGALSEEKSGYAFEERRRDRILHAAARRRTGFWGFAGGLASNPMVRWSAAAVLVLSVLISLMWPTYLSKQSDMAPAGSALHSDRKYAPYYGRQPAVDESRGNRGDSGAVNQGLEMAGEKARGGESDQTKNNFSLSSITAGTGAAKAPRGEQNEVFSVQEAASAAVAPVLPTQLAPDNTTVLARRESVAAKATAGSTPVSTLEDAVTFSAPPATDRPENAGVQKPQETRFGDFNSLAAAPAKPQDARRVVRDDGAGVGSSGQDSGRSRSFGIDPAPTLADGYSRTGEMKPGARQAPAKDLGMEPVRNKQAGAAAAPGNFGGVAAARPGPTEQKDRLQDVEVALDAPAALDSNQPAAPEGAPRGLARSKDKASLATKLSSAAGESKAELPAIEKKITGTDRLEAEPMARAPVAGQAYRQPATPASAPVPQAEAAPEPATAAPAPPGTPPPVLYKKDVSGKNDDYYAKRPELQSADHDLAGRSRMTVQPGGAGGRGIPLPQGPGTESESRRAGGEAADVKLQKEIGEIRKEARDADGRKRELADLSKRKSSAGNGKEESEVLSDEVAVQEIPPNDPDAGKNRYVEMYEGLQEKTAEKKLSEATRLGRGRTLESLGNKPRVLGELDVVQYAEGLASRDSTHYLHLWSDLPPGNDGVSGWQFRLGYGGGLIPLREGRAPLVSNFDSGSFTSDFSNHWDVTPQKGGGLLLPGADAESRFDAFSYFQKIDPSLEWKRFSEQFQGQQLRIPPPQVGDEGLGEREFRRRYRVNPFVDTLRDHLSTFAMDVDPASFTRARNLIRNGQLPPPDSVRVEEFINALPQDYQPDATEVFSVFCDGMPSVFGSPGVDLLRIGIKARNLRPGERRPAVLTFAIDVSGSMSEAERLDLVKNALLVLIDNLAVDDQVAIVAFSNQAALILPHTPARQRERIADAVRSLQPTGGTNVEAGLELAYRIASEALSPGTLSRVLLLSDGAANLGARGPEEILKKVGIFARRGIYLSSVGIGMGRYNDQMLERLANEGNGNYSYVGTADDAVKIFRQNLPAFLEVLAEDAKIQVDFDKKTVARYRLLGYENRDIRDEDFRNDKVDAGEVGPGSTVTALYEVQRRPASTGPLGKVLLRFRDTASRRIVEREFPIPEGVIQQDARLSGPSLRLLAAAAETAELLRGSYYARNGSFGQVLALLLTLGDADRARPEWQELVNMAAQAQRLKIMEIQSAVEQSQSQRASPEESQKK